LCTSRKRPPQTCRNVRSLVISPAATLRIRTTMPNLPKVCNLSSPKSRFETYKSHYSVSGESPTQLPLWDWRQCDRSKPRLKIKRVPPDTRLDADRWWIAVCDGNTEFALPIQLTARETARFICNPPKLDFSLDGNGFPIARWAIEAALERLVDGGVA
jgi:hypothetical protein